MNTRSTPRGFPLRRSVDWLGFFNSQLNGPPASGYHNGNKIIVECWPDNEAQLIEKVDSAIEYANDRLTRIAGSRTRFSFNVVRRGQISAITTLATARGITLSGISRVVLPDGLSRVTR
jgi:hypothetical protein